MSRDLDDAAIGGVIGSIEGLGQDVLIAPQVLEHICSHKQLKKLAREAGGQLFGTIHSDRVCIAAASGPYPEDERTRCRYRSNPNAAQREIDRQFKMGLIYLGEWHTHAESRPSPSALDLTVMRKILSSSKLNSNALLMLIVGRSNGCKGLGLWTISSHCVYTWELGAKMG